MFKFVKNLWVKFFRKKENYGRVFANGKWLQASREFAETVKKITVKGF